MARTRLQTLADTVQGLIEAASLLKGDAPTSLELQQIIERGEFRPAEDEAVGYWFARFLTIRESLWSVIDDVRTRLAGTKSSTDQEHRYFIVGYASVCVLVGIDRLMLFDVAKHSIIQRKFNEPFPELRIPRKQFTRVFEAFIQERNALTLLDVMKFAKKNRHKLMAFSEDPDVGVIARQLPRLRKVLDPSFWEYLRGAWAFVSHKWRRRGVVTVNRSLAGVMEGVGRAASDLYKADDKLVTDDIRNAIGEFLEPGDVIVSRHAVALTNLFIPGFWPHAAFYVGTPEQRNALGVSVPDDKRALWTGQVCTLDERGVVHEGKMYNFDFDFFSSDRLVCTEVVYRSYDGLDGIQFPLTERAGRKTLSAEDLLDFALDADVFEPVAIFGVEGCDKGIVFGDQVRPLLMASYTKIPSSDVRQSLRPA
jgi:hypothetical protein